MKKVLLFLFFIISVFVANSQTLRPSQLPTTNAAGRFDITGYQMDSAFLYVLRDSFPAKYPSVIYHPNGNLYKTTGGAGAHWNLVTDTTWLSNRIDLKLNIADTAAMLSNYLRKTDTANLVAPYMKYSDTSNMLTPYHQSFYTATFDTATRILTMYPITGTVPTILSIPRGGSISGISSLTPYRVPGSDVQYLVADNGDAPGFTLKTADSATIMHFSDTATMLAPYARSQAVVKYYDTSAMLSKYVRYTDTANIVANRLKISDTATMLSNRLKISDTANMLAGYKTYYPRTAISGGSGITYDPVTGIISNGSPSSGGTVTSVSAGVGMNFTTITTTGPVNADTLVLATRLHVDSIAMRKLNLTDTAAMLSNRLKISDTATMLTPFVRTYSAQTVNGVKTFSNTLVGSDSIVGGNNIFLRYSGNSLYGRNGADNAYIPIIKTNTDDRIYLDPNGNGALTGAKLTVSDSLIAASNILFRFNGRYLYGRNGADNDYIPIIRIDGNDKVEIDGLGNGSMFNGTINSASIATGGVSDSILVVNGGTIKKVLRSTIATGGTVTSVATNTGTGISGGTITSSGTLLIDTLNLSTRLWRQKGVDSVMGQVALKLNISDTSSMLSNRLKISDTTTMLSGYGRKGFSVQYTDTASMLSNRLKISDTLTMLSNYRRKTTAITNSDLTNSSITIGSTAISLGGTATTISGLTSLSATTLTGTLSTAAQPNITSLGTLTGLSVSGISNLTGVVNIDANATSTEAIQLNGTANNQYIAINSGTGYEAMFKSYNPTAGSWYMGVRANAGLGSTSSWHLFSSTYGGDVMVGNTDGTIKTASSVTASSLIKSGGTSSQALIADGSVQSFASGIYTPTLTNVANVSSITPGQATWTQVGNIVTVHGSFTLTATSATASTTFSVSIPVASASLNSADVNGVAFFAISGGGYSGITGYAYGNGTSHLPNISFKTDANTNFGGSYEFQYYVH